MLNKKKVTIYTDGACSGNPGPGGWGAILCYRGKEKEISGGEEQTTNNRMELTAVISALECLKEPCEVDLYSDSKYVIDALERIGLFPGRKKDGSKATKNLLLIRTFGRDCFCWSPSTKCIITGSKDMRKTNTTTAVTHWLSLSGINGISM